MNHTNNIIIKGTYNGEFEFTLSFNEQLPALGDLDIKIQGNKAYLFGELGSKSYLDILDLHEKHPEVTTLVLSYVPGSLNTMYTLQMGYLVREFKYNTYLPENGFIASGGTYLFISGVDRTINKNYYKIGVHSWISSKTSSSVNATEGSNLEKDDILHKPFISYCKAMLGENLGEDFYWFSNKAASPNSIYSMTPNDIVRYNYGKIIDY